MRPVLVITHLERGELGLLGDVLAERDVPVLHRALDEGDRLPELGEVAGVVSLGGTMGVPDADRHPFLGEERKLLASAMATEVPTLGLCLGAQILTWAAGGSVARMKERDVAWYRLARSGAAAGDPLFDAWPDDAPVLEWHLDQIVLPGGTEVLADSPGPGTSIFRAGPAAWGSQVHLELTPEILHRWLADPEMADELREAGIAAERLMADADELLPRQAAAAVQVFERFAKLARSREAAPVRG